MNTRKTYSAGEIIRDAGITYRQLDYWTRRGYVRELNPAAGSGINRRYSAQEVWRIRLMAQLVNAGLSLDAAINLTFTGEYDDKGVYRSKLGSHVYVEVFPT